MGQNQTGENVVRSEAGATVTFGILSDAAQVAVKQDLGNITFGPTARIQRQVVPLPPLPPVSTAERRPHPHQADFFDSLRWEGRVYSGASKDPRRIYSRKLVHPAL